MKTRRCKGCNNRLPIDNFAIVLYKPAPGRVTEYQRWKCEDCIRARKRKRYKQMTDRARKERRASQRMKADDKRREEGRPVRKTKNHLL